MSVDLSQKLFLFLVMVSFSTNVSLAQELGCATRMDISALRGSTNLAAVRQLDVSSSDQFQPFSRLAVSAHIVRNSDGSGGISEEYLFNELDMVNASFIDARIQFFIDQIYYVNNSQLYDFNSNEEGTLANSRDVANTINVYFVERIAFVVGTACGYAYLPNLGPDRIIISESCGLAGNTLAHEFGHFFNLIHTHGSSNSYNSTDELADGSNCNEAGDFVCDTPADPVLTNQVNSSCEYVGTFLDANQQPYDPDTRNLLSYSRGSCRESLTNGQLTRIMESLASSRSYIKTFPVQSNFRANSRKICQNEEVVFTDLSEGASAWEWVFEGGIPATSNQQHPRVTYSVPGNYNVSLKVTGVDREDFLSFENYVIVRSTPPESESILLDFEDLEDINDLETEATGVFEFDLNNVYKSQGQKSIWINSFARSINVESNSKFFTTPITEYTGGEFLLQFDVAYRMRTDYSDRLDVLTESYCERVGAIVYSQSELHLSGGQISEKEFFPENSDWRTQGVFFNVEEVQDPFNIVFEATLEGGNNLYIDNIRVRPVKPIDADSLLLVQIYESLDGELPWDIKGNVESWSGVTLSQESKVTRLDFSGLQLNKDLPSSLSQLTELDTLILDRNNFGVLEILTELEGVSVLSISDNNLGAISIDWSQMSDLKSINLSNNQIVVLPSSLLSHNGIETINVRNNRLEFDFAQQLTPTLDYLDLSANSLNQNPILVTQDDRARINLSQNNLALSSIIQEYRPSWIYSPQNLIGSVKHYATSESLELACPTPEIQASTTISWYRNNELIPGSSASLLVSDLSGSYYQCKVSDNNLPEVELLSKPFLVNIPRSICEQNLSGTYLATTTYTDSNSQTSVLNSEITLTTRVNQLYEISDLSFGVEVAVYNQSELMNSMFFDCGEFLTPRSKHYANIITSTDVDVNSGRITLDWVDLKGGTGRTILILQTPGLSNETDILSFSFSSQSATAVIDSYDRSIVIRVGCKDFSNIPTFELSAGATAYVEGELQESGFSAQDFTQPVTYNVIAEDGATMDDWVVTLLEDPSEVSVSLSIENQTFCAPLNGVVSITDITVDGLSKIGDLDEFEIMWSSDSDFENIIGDGIGIENLNSGEYFLRVAEISSGCGVQIDQILVLDLTPNPTLTIESTSVDISCGGINTGSIATTIDGLSPSYLIEWSYNEGGEWVSLDEFDGLKVIEDLKSGFYRQDILDQVSGCTFSQEVVIQSRPSIITANLIILPESDCDNPNGSISIARIIKDGITIDEPNGDFSYQWFDNSNMEVVIGSGISLDNLRAGNYYLKVIENNLLCESQTYTVYVPANTLTTDILISSKQDNTLCSSIERNGTISVIVDGNLEDYTFEWFSGTNLSLPPFRTGFLISQLSGGTYTVKVTSITGSEEGCYSTLTISIIDDIDKLELTLKSEPNTNCKSPNGQAQVETFTVDGQITPISGVYELEWSTNRFFGTVLSDEESISNLPEMEYFARVINTITGCKTSTVSVRVNSEFPDVDPVFQVEDNVHCIDPFTGAIHMSGLESIDYKISWYNQSPEIQETPISGSTSLVNLRSGVYYAIVEELESRCSEQFSHIIMDQTSIPQVTVETKPQQNCTTADGYLEVARIDEGGVAQGIDNYNVEWSSTDDFSEILSNDLKVTDLTAGDYYLRVLNSITGCSSEVYNYQVSDATLEPVISLTAMSEEQPALDALGELEIAVEYNGAYRVQWFEGSPGATDNPIGTELILSSLTAGNYWVNVTTDQDCSSLAEFEVTKDDRVLPTIALDMPTEVFVDDTPVLLSASSTSGLPISFKVDSGPGKIVLNDLVLTGTGEITIIAETSQSNEYLAASQSIQITVKSLLSLSGEITGTSTGQAKLYNTAWQLVKQSNFSNNEYLINELRPGQYYLEITSSGFSNSSLVTYHPGVYVWKDAGLIDLQEAATVHIAMVIPPSNETGIAVEGVLGRTSGSTLFTVGEIKEVNEPARDVKLILVDQVSSTVASVASSAFDGSLTFEYVPIGNYYLLINEIDNELDLSSVIFSVNVTESVKQFTLELGDNGQIELVVVSGIDDWTSGEINLFPNPTTGELNIVLERELPYAVELRVFNLAGAMMVSEMIAPGLSNFQLPLNSLKSGTYLVQLSDPNGSTTKKIIKR
ncbi:MAG: T9SS type A sorting domain-containing protein [Cyclobacteriaceae bacterium]